MRIPLTKQEKEVVSIFNQHKEMMVGLTYRILLNKSEAEDAVTEAVIKMLTLRKEKYDRIKDPVKYTYRIAKYTAFEMKKKRTTRKEREEGVADYLATEENKEMIEKSELRNNLLLPDFSEKMEKILNPRQLEALKLWTHGYSYEDIADEMESTEGQVRGLIERAKNKMRKLKPWVNQLE